MPGAELDKYSRGVRRRRRRAADLPGRGRASVLGRPRGRAGMVRYVGHAEVQALVHAAAPEAVTAEGRVQAWVCRPGLRHRASRAKEVAEQQHHVARRRWPPTCPSSSTPAGWSCSTAPRGAHPPHPARRGAGPAADPPRAATEVTARQRSECPAGHAREPPSGPAAPCCSRAHTLVVSRRPSRPVRSQADAPAWLGHRRRR